MKRKYLKRIMVAVLATTLLVGNLENIPVQAEEGGVQETTVQMESAQTEESKIQIESEEHVLETGKCGNNITYILRDDGTLTLSGKGPMYDYSNSSESPFNKNNNNNIIDSIIIGDGITRLGNWSFSYISYLKYIEIPKTVTAIGDGTFYSSGFANEEINIEIPDSVTSIGDEAFSSVNLVEIKIPNSVTSIGDEAFHFNSQLIKVTIPANVKKMGRGVFSDCYGLTEAEVLGGKLGDETFLRCRKLKSVKLASGVTEIGQSAFEQCESLKTIEIPDSVTNIGERAFAGSGLTNVTLPSSVSELKAELFSACTSLTDVKIPDSISNIGVGVFNWCNGLTSIEIPASVASIGEYAFSESGLTNVKIPASVTNIGDYAFFECNGLTSIEIPASVTNIGDYAFFECLNLSEIKIKGNKTGIGKYVFGFQYHRTENGWTSEAEKVNNFVLYCYAGSTAETYAKTNDIPYKYIDAIDDLRFYDSNGNMITNQFTFDGSYTYFMQADGSPMRDTLTYHPDGEHIIYLDSNGHEVFNSFQYCPSVGYTCYFDSNGYIYKDQITFVGDKTYYLNGNGKMENEGWFQFSNGRDFGYANWDGTLNTGGFSYDPWGRVVFYHWNGMVARGLITDGQWYYLMDETDGHYVGSFPVN